MAFGLFRKRRLEPAADVGEPMATPVIVAEPAVAP
jgi:hypothetical protein